MICVADLETTSRNVFEAEIIHGHFICLNHDLEVISTHDMRCNPGKWSDEAEVIHGISKRTASKYKQFKEVYGQFIDWLEAYQITEFWCHSNSVMYGKLVYYDYAVLRLNMLLMGDAPYFAIEKLRPYSTHSLCKMFHMEHNFDGYSLDKVCSVLNIELKHHDARSDAQACVEIMKQLLHRTTRDAITAKDKGEEDEKRINRASKQDSVRSRKRQSFSFTI